MKVVLTQYEIKQAINYYLEDIKKLKTKTYAELSVENNKVTAEVQLSDEQA